MEKKYLDTLLSQIREKHAKKRIRQEVKSHIDDQKAAYMIQGLDENQAEEKAVADMGDPIQTGTALDLIHKPKPAWGMLAVIAVLCAVGVLLQYVMYQHIPNQMSGNSYYFQRQCLHAILGFFVLCIVYLIDYTWIAKYSKWICTGILLFLFITLVLNNDPSVIQNHRIIFPSTLSLSSEPFVYLYIPAYGALLFSFRNSKKPTLWKALLYLILPIYLAIWIEHLSLLLNLSFILLVMFFTAATKGWFNNDNSNYGSHTVSYITRYSSKVHATTICGAIIGIIAFCMLLLQRLFSYSYRIARIRAWLNPQKHAAGAGYINHTIHNILSNSQLIGENNSQPIFGSLPQYSTDYLLTSIIGYFGILSAAALVLLIIMFGIKLLCISIRQTNQLGMIMGLGCSLLFFIQTIEYVLVNLGLLPSAGLYFPLISYGGSSMLQTCIFLGILLSIYRYQDLVSEPNIKSAEA